MTTRRDFLKQAALLSGAAGVTNFLPASLLRAMEMNPAPGSTYLDAEHIVILMQENRSFDHSFGSLRGVRGFNDPRVATQPNGNPVWLQTNKAGDTYAPFRLDMNRTNATWMGDVPHSRHTQVDAYNGGNHDRWLHAKRPSNPKYHDMPLTLGYYTRQDLPFYYALADAFTICDQNFSSAMTSTHPNRLFSWTGTIREEQRFGARANIRNTDSGWAKHRWKTFPERLEEQGIPWKFYQNDLSCGGGFTGEERSWLTNYACNPLEWFHSYQVKYFDRYTAGLRRQVSELPAEIAALEAALQSEGASRAIRIKSALETKRTVLATAQEELHTFSAQAFTALPEATQHLHHRAFTTNKENPGYRTITEFRYQENGQEHTANMPGSDTLHQFRKDVQQGILPAVSWLASPQKFSDHPSAPWYGAWMVSEVLDILTQNPEVWKKTIFILNYDENDGYFDHQPPFVAPYPDKPLSGRCSPGIDTGVEHITKEDELRFGENPALARSGPVGLGFRVPMIVASPWSRGGKVCSQVFDHTSVLMFLEHFFAKKLGKDIRETNISAWRRTVCGNLTSVFTPYQATADKLPFVEQKEMLQRINQVKSAPEPSFKTLAPEQVAAIRAGDRSVLPRQETGLRKSAALPYELYADGYVEQGIFKLELRAGNEQFGERAWGAPFKVYLPGDHPADKEGLRRDYAVAAGAAVTDEWKISDFINGSFALHLHGPNGFFRSFILTEKSPPLRVSFHQRAHQPPELRITNQDEKIKTIALVHNSYGYPPVTIRLQGKFTAIPVALDRSHGWYDFRIAVPGFEAHYAGRVENGKESFSDPLLAG